VKWTERAHRYVTAFFLQEVDVVDVLLPHHACPNDSITDSSWATIRNEVKISVDDENIYTNKREANPRFGKCSLLLRDLNCFQQLKYS
jgi:hypothetical protein